MHQQLQWSAAFALVLVLIAISAITLVAYRLYLSPLAQIPGPKIAAVSGLYEFYYDCVLGGRYTFEIERMHNVYGPIVRISPHEVHIKDSEYFLRLHSGTMRLDKYAWYYDYVAAPEAGFGTAAYELHRSRRTPVAKYFSTANVAKLEPLIQTCVSKLALRLQEHQREDKPIDLSNAYRCLATDVITEYALPSSRHMLDSPDFAASYNRVLRDSSKFAIWNRHLPVIIPILNTIPRWIIEKVDTGPALAVFDNQMFLKDSAATIAASHGESKKIHRSTILHEVYNSDLQHSKQSVRRIVQEAQVLVAAGTETVGKTLSMTTFRLLADRRKAQTLRRELSTFGGNGHQSMNFQDLQNLPYLSAVISEGLRISSSVTGRLPRVNPTAAMEYKSYTIPAGTAISMSIPDIHFDEAIFPDAHQFKPERWLGDEGQALGKYLVPFGKGPRSCVAINLALAEMYLAIGCLFGRFEMELYGTKEEDMAVAHDFFSSFGPADSKGLRVVVLGRGNSKICF